LGFRSIALPQIFRGVGMMFAIVPITNLALGTLPPARLKNASGLFNLARNLGGAVGLALSTRCSTIASICIWRACTRR